MPKKTVCEVEFEKWWQDRIFRNRLPINREWAELVWESAWRTCADKIMELIKKK